MKNYFVFLFGSCFFFSTSFAQVDIGNSVPTIQISDWIENVPEDTSLQDKFIIMDFWATWCGPCIAAVPHFNELVGAYGDREDVCFLSISDESATLILNTLKRVDFRSIVVSDQSRATHDRFGVEGIPETFLIDKEGILRWRGHPESLTSEMVTDFLAGKNLEKKMMKVDLEEVLQVAEKKDKKEKPKRSFFTALKQLGDTTIRYTFTVDTMAQSGLSAISKTLPKAYVSFGKRLAESLGDLFEIPATLIDLPKDLDGHIFNITYINRRDADKERPNRALKIQLLSALGLRHELINVEKMAYVVSILDKSKLEPSPESPQLGLSDAGNRLVVSNSSMEDVLSAMAKKLERPFFNATQLAGTYNFILRHDSEKAMIKSFKSYGLQVELKKIEEQRLKFSYK